ncbi:hypothetical protein KKC97_13135 [bacterium]|nr:hypothetical protein [bacterium]
MSQPVFLLLNEYPINFHHARAEFEVEFISTVLKACGGNVSRASELIGLSRRNLQAKIKKRGIDIDAIRSGELRQSKQLRRDDIESAISILRSVLKERSIRTKQLDTPTNKKSAVSHAMSENKSENE